MEKDKEKTIVIFKILEGEVIALFPELAETNDLIMSYMRVGQHSAASPELIDELKNATPKQYASLKRELESLGYDLLVVRG